MNFRKEKLTSLLTRLITEYIFTNMKRADARVTVTRIDLASDFKKAKIFVTIEPEEKASEVFDELKKLRLPLRKKIAHTLTIKFIPLFEFVLDTGEKNRARIEELLEKLSAENGKK